MPRFQGIIENEKYTIGCTGQTVWVWDKNDTVLTKFKDLIYADRAAISPCGDIFVVKSVAGRLAVYSLETLSLRQKIRFSRVNVSQDDGFCFSPDGKYFLNVERQEDDLHSAISIYNTSDFSLVSRTLLGEDLMISHIQEVEGEYYVLGFDFVAKYKNNEICDIRRVTSAEQEFYWEHLNQTMFGMMLDDGQEIKAVHTLRDLWEYRK